MASLPRALIRSRDRTSILDFHSRTACVFHICPSSPTLRLVTKLVGPAPSIISFLPEDPGIVAHVGSPSFHCLCLMTGATTSTRYSRAERGRRLPRSGTNARASTWWRRARGNQLISLQSTSLRSTCFQVEVQYFPTRQVGSLAGSISSGTGSSFDVFSASSR